MKNLLSATLLSSLLATPVLSQAYIDQYVGEVYFVAGDFCPTGSLEANGQILNINSYNPLFSLLGIIYGGDGMKTFALPKVASVYADTDNGDKTKPGKIVLKSCIVWAGVYPERPQTHK